MTLKTAICVYLLSFFMCAVKAQSGKVMGTYIKQLDRHTVEKITLKKNATFEYFRQSMLGVIKETGYWVKKHDTLRLNSKVKQKPLQVIADFSEKMKLYQAGTIFIVEDKKGRYLDQYSLLIYEDGDTTRFDKLFGNVLIPGSIDKFSLIDRMGYVYPVYTLKEAKANIIKITTEQKDVRLFDNEVWLFEKGGITPRNFRGNKTTYKLKKRE